MIHNNYGYRVTFILVRFTPVNFSGKGQITVTFAPVTTIPMSVSEIITVNCRTAPDEIIPFFLSSHSELCSNQTRTYHQW